MTTINELVNSVKASYGVVNTQIVENRVIGVSSYGTVVQSIDIPEHLLEDTRDYYYL